MLRTLAFILFSIFLSAQVTAGTDPQSGKYQVINTAGFVQQGERRTQLVVDRHSGVASLKSTSNGGLHLEINGSGIRLFPIENGLASVQWNAEGTPLLHDVDILALFGADDPSNIAAWGADLNWPGTTSAQLVLFALRSDALAGFLVSETQGKTVVRQMEFRRIVGPSNRPQTSVRSNIARKN